MGPGLRQNSVSQLQKCVIHRKEFYNKETLSLIITSLLTSVLVLRFRTFLKRQPEKAGITVQTQANINEYIYCWPTNVSLES